MSRRGNCHDNTVVEGFFQLLKREWIKRRIYPDRATARSDVFDDIGMFYNPNGSLDLALDRAWDLWNKQRRSTGKFDLCGSSIRLTFISALRARLA